MAAPLVNIAEFAHILDLLDRVASSAIVDRALQNEGLNRKVLQQGAGFLPYRLEASVLEYVARAIGDHRIGDRLARQFDYSTYDAYARYVLGAKDLASALFRGRQAFSLTHPGSEIVLRKHGGHVLVGRRSGLTTVIGSRHLDDGAIVIIDQVIRHFLGPDWRPAWIETTSEDSAGTIHLEDTAGVLVRTGAEMPAIAVRASELHTPNPSPPGVHEVVGFLELPALMGIDPPKTMADAVQQVLRTQLALGDMSEESVASRLSIGRRTLQRALRAEGTSFREVKARFIESRARAVLVESELDISTIARSLGYDEPKSFRRAFRNWTGLTPNAYRTVGPGI